MIEVDQNSCTAAGRTDSLDMLDLLWKYILTRDWTKWKIITGQKKEMLSVYL